MRFRELPPIDQMYEAVLRRDASFDGVFFTAVTTTGIFCRPTCPARKPARDNVEFFPSPRDALFAGYRPCRRCRPLEPAGAAPDWLRPLLDAVQESPEQRWKDTDLRSRGIEPSRVRRWFKEQYGMTFHAYQRGIRLGRALGQLREGRPVTSTAFDSGWESLSGFNDAIRRLAGKTPTASRSTTIVHLTRFLTPLGPMVAGSVDDAICLLEFSDRRMLERQLARISSLLKCTIVPGTTTVLAQLEEELDQYFRGLRQQFTVPLVTPGSEFQQSVWNALLKIPYGQTRSYAQQAALVGRPDAVRAVARANGDNRIAIVIPCHRVIGADGQLTGYGGGLWRKKWLLDLETGQLDGFKDRTAAPSMAASLNGAFTFEPQHN
jgi:AraC family transcriptional regulator of adaptative response/methylated-DNA-[protein]-cysteine methyltransferase